MATGHFRSRCVPIPDAPVDVLLKERDGSGFHEVWKMAVDPKDKFIDRSRPPSPGALMELQKMGDPANKVDLLVLGDGYTAVERGKFEKDARQFMEAVFATSPFREHREGFQCVGTVSGGGGVGRVAAFEWDLPAFAGGGGLRRVRFGALRVDLGESHDAGYGVVCSV